MASFRVAGPARIVQGLRQILDQVPQLPVEVGDGLGRGAQP
jgi:hypothetical protein